MSPTAADLDSLRRYDTPTICNALELVVPERRALGFTTETLVCPFPDRPPMVGFARTALIKALQPAAGSAAEQKALRLDYYRYVARGDEPRILVIQDTDSRVGFGCFWGEVQTAVHKGLGCEGLVTNGGVRDLDAIAEGFQVLCGKVTPSHAHVHLVAIGCEVDVFGMVCSSDDLIHADRHGAVVIPRDVAKQVPEAAELCARREAPVLAAARAPGFTLASLEAALAEAAEIH
jgi:regulator of RNase E activity RraA